MRVLHLIHNLEIGGAQVLLRTLLAGQRASDVDATVAAWRRGGPILDELAGNGESVHLCPPASSGSLWGTYRWLRSLLDEHGPDVLHAHMPDSSFWGSVLSRRCGLPFIVSYYSNRLLFHSIDRDSLYGRIRWHLLKYGAGRAAANVACTQSVREQMTRDLQLPETEVDVVLNGVEVPPEPKRPDAAACGAAGAARGPMILAVGRLEEIKGQYQLVDCAPRLLQQHPDARIVIVGEGPMAARWKDRAARLGVDRAITFTGRVDDPVEYLCEADVYVSPSRYEGISLGLLEAMSWRVPVVASRVVGNVDVISDGVEGLLYPLDDADALADAIARVLEEVGATGMRVDNARAKVEARFSAEAMCAGYRDIYLRAMSGRRPPYPRRR